MKAAWPRVDNSTTIMGWGIDEFLEILSELIIAEWADTAPDPRGDSPELMKRLVEFIDIKSHSDRIAQIASYRCGSMETGIFPSEAAPGEKPGLSGESIFHITLQLAHALVHSHGWTTTRAELARSQIHEYLIKRYDKKKDSRSKHKAPSGDRGAPLADILYPNGNAVDSFLADRLQFLGSQPYKVAAFVLALPPWMEFLAGKGMADEGLKIAYFRYAKKQFAPLPGVLDNCVYDPVMAAEVRAHLEKTANGE